MADKTILLRANDGSQVLVKYHDNGDGTFSPTDVSAAGEAHIGQVGGNTARAETSFTALGGGTAYAANDAVSNSNSATTPLEFDLGRVSGKPITITHARMTVNQASLTMTFRLWLYRDTPASPANDNAAFSTTWANRAARIGYIDFTAPISGSDCTDYYGTAVYSAPFTTVPVGTKVYGLLQTPSGGTITANTAVYLALDAYQD